MKKIILPILLLAGLSAKAQATNGTKQAIRVGVIKRDSLRFDSAEVITLYNNARIIQQNLHVLHIDGILRDKLDSVYKVSADIIEKRFKKADPVKGKKNGN